MLALGGGGARGLAHLGVLSVLEEADVPVRGIAGTSAGSVIGALWLLLGSAAAARAKWRELLSSGLIPVMPELRFSPEMTTRENLLQFIRTFANKSVRSLALGRQSLVTKEEFDRALAFLVGDATLESLRLPLSVVVSDFETGLPIALRRGSLRTALAASCAIPAVLPPYRIEDRVVVDGGVVAEVPAEAAWALGRGPVVAVDISDTAGKEDLETISAPRALIRAGLLMQTSLRQRMNAAARLVLRPAMPDIQMFDFQRTDEAYEAGRAAALAHLTDIRRITSGSSVKVRVGFRKDKPRLR